MSSDPAPADRQVGAESDRSRDVMSGGSVPVSRRGRRCIPPSLDLMNNDTAPVSRQVAAESDRSGDVMSSDPAPLSRQVAARYFEMWNTGDSSIAAEILSPGWVDHAHPEITSPQAVQLAVERIRAAQPDLQFRIEAILGDGDLVTVVGAASRDPHPTPAATGLIWLFRLKNGKLAEMWTYHDTSRPAPPAQLPPAPNPMTWALGVWPVVRSFRF